MQIRPADATDLPAVQRIVREAYTKYIARIGKPPGPMNDDYAALIRAHQVWVIGDPIAGAPISGVIVLLPEADHLLLDNVAVDPAAQGQGVGRALITFAETEARRRGIGELRLYTHETMVENIALYARTGWAETGRAEQNGFARVFFRKSLPT
jgi:ribosomal protein S18 acetylase RimI-like enzyme